MLPFSFANLNPLAESYGSEAILFQAQHAIIALRNNSKIGIPIFNCREEMDDSNAVNEYPSFFNALAPIVVRLLATKELGKMLQPGLPKSYNEETEYNNYDRNTVGTIQTDDWSKSLSELIIFTEVIVDIHLICNSYAMPAAMQA